MAPVAWQIPQIVDDVGRGRDKPQGGESEQRHGPGVDIRCLSSEHERHEEQRIFRPLMKAQATAQGAAVQNRVGLRIPRQVHRRAGLAGGGVFVGLTRMQPLL